jgi:hypothetical protein
LDSEEEQYLKEYAEARVAPEAIVREHSNQYKQEKVFSQITFTQLI